MLTESQQQTLIFRFCTDIQFFGHATLPSKPQYLALYAFEMSDSTVKIGVSQQVKRRSLEVANATGLDVLRVHQTGLAPRAIAFRLEKRLHNLFADRNARNEFFNITFEEAVAELDKLADEITREREKAEQLFKDECEFFETVKQQYLEQQATTVQADDTWTILSEIRSMFFQILEAVNSSSKPVQVNDIRAIFLEILKIATSKPNAEKILELLLEIFKQITQVQQEKLDFERGKVLAKLVLALKASPKKERIADIATNLIVGEKVF